METPSKVVKKIGILTGIYYPRIIMLNLAKTNVHQFDIHFVGGGDCPGLNAVIRAVVLSCAKKGVECIGFVDGFEGN